MIEIQTIKDKEIERTAEFYQDKYIFQPIDRKLIYSINEDLHYLDVQDRHERRYTREREEAKYALTMILFQARQEMLKRNFFIPS